MVPTNIVSDVSAGHERPQPQQTSAADQNLWNAAYSAVQGQNVYQPTEGPYQALKRLEETGVLPKLSDESLLQQAREKSAARSQAQGGDSVPTFTIQDSVLSPTEANTATKALFETQLKDREAQRLAPNEAQLQQALTAQVASDMQTAGLSVQTADQLRKQIINAMEADPGLHGVSMEKMATAPVGAPYVATGAVTASEMQDVLKQQIGERKAKQNDSSFAALKESDPAEYKKQWGQYLQSTDVGAILQQRAQLDPGHYNAAKIAAANELITNLQNQNLKH